MAGDYIKCPRCDLNYIHKDQEYCDVCKSELKMGPKLIFALDENEEYEDMEICPICKLNYIRLDEEVCASCREELELSKEEVDLDKDEEWRAYLEDDKELLSPEENEEILSLSQLAEEEDVFDEDDEEFFDDPDDFEEVPFDDFDEDFDDEDDENLDDEDEDF